MEVSETRLMPFRQSVHSSNTTTGSPLGSPLPLSIDNSTRTSNSLREYPRPKGRDGFEIAIMCALSIEASAVQALFDDEIDIRPYGKEIGDSNAYSAGVMEFHDVVLVHMPSMGKVAAASAAENLRKSFQNIRIVLMVGICGGAPFKRISGKQHTEEILLGDVVISDSLVQYDLGRQFPNQFVRKDTPRDNLSRPNPEIRAVLAKLQTDQGVKSLQNRISEYLSVMQLKQPRDKSAYPGRTNDRLFKPDYYHKHHRPEECAICANGTEEFCNEATEKRCETLGCDNQNTISRKRSPELIQPIVHFGLVASGDTVMRSGRDRDEIASRDGVIAFEMEGAGAWDSLSTLVIKSVCDYSDSHKNKRWQGYAAAAAAAAAKAFLVENWKKSTPMPLPRAIESRQERGWTAKKRKAWNKLKKSAYRDAKDRNPDRTPGTCKWFVEHNLFRDWQEKKSEALWVSADPGCGKSVLAKYLVDHVVRSDGSRTTCYFFFKDDFEDQKSVVGALCCILHQLFDKKPWLFSEDIIAQLEENEEKFISSFSELWDTLLKVSEDDNAGEIVCILDAIDECQGEDGSLLARALNDLYRNPRNSNLKFLVTSRPFGRIRKSFHLKDIARLAVVHLSGEDDVESEKISREIDIFIGARVQGVGGILMLDDDDKQRLLDGLMRIPNRTYLWVHLTLDLIENSSVDERQIANIISQLPKSVDEAYDKILSKSRDLRKAKKILHIVIVAARPLTVKEMGFALAIEKYHKPYRELELYGERALSEEIRDACGLFVVVVDSRIYLLHQTAKEFLVLQNMDENSSSRSQDLEWRQSLEVSVSHRILADICIWHLLFQEFEADLLQVDKYNGVSEYVNDHLFLDYSANHWASHVRQSPIEFEASVAKSILAICDTNLARFKIWFYIYWSSTNTSFPNGFTPLLAASYFGLVATAKCLLKTMKFRKYWDLKNVDQTFYRTAISWAASNGHDAVVKLLLNFGKSTLRRITEQPSQRRKNSYMRGVDLRDKYGRTPLTHAVWNGNMDVITWPHKSGARSTPPYSTGGSRLIYAIANEHLVPVDLSVEELLLEASNTGGDVVVKLLLDYGANTEVGDQDGMTPLHYAATRRSDVLVKLLLDHGAKIESRCQDGRTPLHYAMMRGNDNLVKLLLDHGAEIESRCQQGRTPLHYAMMGSSDNLVKLLLDHGAKIESRCQDGRTPLHYAVLHLSLGKRGVPTAVQHLLEHGANVNSRTDRGITPLLQSIHTDSNAYMAKYLIERGANVNSRDDEGNTPLSLAIKYDRTWCIRLLEGAGATV